MSDKLDDMCKSLALESIGIHPKSIAGLNGYEKRSDWQNGWNEAILKVHENATNISKHFKEFSKENREKLISLLDSDAWIEVDDAGKVHLELNMNDTFAYASADLEEFEEKDIAEIYDLRERYGFDGVTAWASHKRGDKPIESYRTDKFKKAMGEIKNGITKIKRRHNL